MLENLKFIKYYHFNNESNYYSYGFNHKSQFFFEDANGWHEFNNTSHYLNRTWERYKYQSCMYGAVSNAINYRIEKLKDIFKKENNIKRLTKKYKQSYNQLLASDNLLIDLYTIQKSL